MTPRRPVVEIMDDAMADILRQKTEVERLHIGLRIWKSARAILRAAIRSEHPDWDENQVNREIACRISNGVVTPAIQDEVLGNGRLRTPAN